MAERITSIVDFSRGFWKKLGDEVADRIRVHTTVGGKDVNNNAFKPYSESYRIKKTTKKVQRQSSSSSKPDLQLTGDMMRNLQTRGFTKDNVVVGWRKENAEKVQWNADMGRVVTSTKQPVSKGIERYIVNQIDNTIERNIKKYASKPTVINVKR